MRSLARCAPPEQDRWRRLVFHNTATSSAVLIRLRLPSHSGFKSPVSAFVPRLRRGYPPTNTTSFFFQRLYARSATGGFQLGLSVSSTNTTNALVWGSDTLNLSETYTAVLKWDFLAGDSNDPVSVFVDPIGDLLTNTSYATATWGTLEPTNVAALNLRQGSAANARTASFDSITVQVVPEPSTYAMLALAGAGFAGYVIRRRRR